MSFLGFCSPIVATILGFAFLGETFSPLQLLGAAILAGAIVLVQLTPARKPVLEPERELQRSTL